MAWCEGLGQPIFVGSSGRVFPKAMKASPLLRAWLARLEGLGVRIVTRRQLDWVGRRMARCAFARRRRAHRGGCDGAGAGRRILAPAGRGRRLDRGAAAAADRAAAPGQLRLHRRRGPSMFRSRFAGAPLKRIALRFTAMQPCGARR